MFSFGDIINALGDSLFITAKSCLVVFVVSLRERLYIQVIVYFSVIDSVVFYSNTALVCWAD